MVMAKDRADSATAAQQLNGASTNSYVERAGFVSLS